MPFCKIPAVAGNLSSAIAASTCIQRRWLNIVAGLLAVALASGFYSPVAAAPVRFRMMGTVEVVDFFHLLPSEVQTGAPFVGYFFYDSSATHNTLPADTAAGDYLFSPADIATAPFGLSVQVGQTLFRGDPRDGFNVRVGDGDPLAQPQPNPLDPGGPPLSSVDVVSAGGFHALKSFEYPFTGYTLEDWISIYLSDPSASALNSAALPSYLDPAKFHSYFDNGRLVGSWFDVSGDATVQAGMIQRPFFQMFAFIDYIVAVPEPTCARLILPAIVAVALARA